MFRQSESGSVLARAATWLVVGPVIAIGIATYIELTSIVPYMVVVLGIGLIVAGVQAWREGYVALDHTSTRESDARSDIPANVWAIVLMLGGVAVLLAVVFFVLGFDRRIEGWIQFQSETRVGSSLILALVSLIGIAWASSMVIYKTRPGPLWFVLSLPYRGVGVVFALIALAVLVGAIINILAPEQLELYKATIWNWATSPLR